MIPRADLGEDSYVGSGRLEGRRALVTGGDSGIGAATAIAYAREGADVAITCLPDEESDAKRIVFHIEQAGRRAVLVLQDISSPAASRKVVAEAVEQLGGLDILVLNAGRQVWTEHISEITDEQLETTFSTNVLSMFWMVRAALPHMEPGASIITTTSIQAYQPSPTLLDYATTKGAIRAFTHGLSQQLAPEGIRVNGVAPGPIWTPLQPSQGQPQEKLTSFGQGTPLGRAGQPAELAPAYVYLASQESSFVVGEILAVTGGQISA